MKNPTNGKYDTKDTRSIAILLGRGISFEADSGTYPHPRWTRRAALRGPYRIPTGPGTDGQPGRIHTRPPHDPREASVERVVIISRARLLSSRS